MTTATQTRRSAKATARSTSRTPRFLVVAGHHYDDGTRDIVDTGVIETHDTPEKAIAGAAKFNALMAKLSLEDDRRAFVIVEAKA